MPTASCPIRAGQAGDSVALSEVYGEACRLAFQGLIPHAPLSLMIDKRTPAWWERLLGHGMHLMVLDLEGTVHGYVTFGASRYGDAGYPGEIYEIYVRPSHQGLGLGSELLAAARAKLDRTGLEGHMAWALSASAQSCGFFMARGGREFARAKLMYPQRTLWRVAFGWEAQAA